MKTHILTFAFLALIVNLVRAGLLATGFEFTVASDMAFVAVIVGSGFGLYGLLLQVDSMDQEGPSKEMMLNQAKMVRRLGGALFLLLLLVSLVIKLIVPAS